LDPDGVPKYLNSPQTPLFDKSNTLYGLDRAAKGIRAADRVVVVEGYMDVMQAHQARFTNVVAQLGTALTEGNLRRLVRYTQRIILALDPDTAGQAATMRGLDVARETLEADWQPEFNARGLIHLEGRLSADIRVLTLPSGQDPDDVLRQDPALWAALVDKAMPLVEHYMQTLLDGQDLADPKAKAEIAQDLAPVIRQVSSPVERAHYAQRLARILQVDERSVLDLIGTAPRRQSRQQRPIEPVPDSAPASQIHGERSTTDLETYCLRGLLQMVHLLDEADAILADIGLDPISVRDFTDLENREIFRIWRESIKGEVVPSLEQLAQSVPTALHARLNSLSGASSMTLQNQTWLLEAQVDPGHDAFDLTQEEQTHDILHSLLKLRERNLRRRNAELRYLLEDADGADARTYQQAFSDTTTALWRLQRVNAARQSGEGQSMQPITQDFG
jgi:DNA primase